MLCKKYADLTPNERKDFIGSLHHSCMSDDELFELGKKIIEKAKKKKIFEGVTILPTSPEKREFCREDFKPE